MELSYIILIVIIIFMFLFYLLTTDSVKSLFSRIFGDYGHNRKVKKILKKVAQAHRQLDKKRHSKARRLYAEIEEHYRELPREHKHKVYHHSLELHKRFH